MRDILQQMFGQEDFQERLFLKIKQKDATTFVGAEQMSSPIVQPNPFLAGLIKRVRAKMDDYSKKKEMITKRFPNQSNETVKQFIFNRQAANRLLFSKFEKACLLAVPLTTQQPEDDETDKNYKDKLQSICQNLQRTQESQPLRNSQSIQKRYRGIYTKPYRIHEHKRAQKFSKNSRLFLALAQNLQLLLDWLQSNNQQSYLLPKLEHVLPFMLIEVNFNEKTVDKDKKWIGRKFKQYVMVMYRGDNCLVSSQVQIHEHNKKNPLNIRKYLSDKGYQEEGVLDYFRQVCRALTELIEHKIYHMDMYSRNIIPFKKNHGIEYKIIDFEMALFLDKSDQRVQQSLVDIWKSAREYWSNNKFQEVTNLFDYLLCQKYEGIRELFDKVRAHDRDFYRDVFVNQPNSDLFIDYLLTYMECYYRYSLLEILNEIKGGWKWLNDHQKELSDIIIKHQPFSDIDKQINAVWANRF